MTHIEFIMLNYDAVYEIIDGPNQGKQTMISSIDIPTRTITSKGGTVFPIEVLRAKLRSIDEMTEKEAIWFFNLYWGSTKMMRGDTNSVVEASKETFMHIIKGAWYISGDFFEMNKLHQEMRRYHIDIDKGKENNWAV